MLLGRWQCAARLFPAWPCEQYFRWSMAHHLWRAPAGPGVVSMHDPDQLFDQIAQIADRLMGAGTNIVEPHRTRRTGRFSIGGAAHTRCLPAGLAGAKHACATFNGHKR